MSGRAQLSGTVALLAVAGLALAVPSTSAAAPCADVDLQPAVLGVERSAAAIGCLVDHERTVAGLGTLAVDPHIRVAAQRYAEDMATRGFFAHESPEGTDPGWRMRAAGFGWSAFGENIAAGQQTPREVIADWLASRGHCQNLMTPMFTVAGYGIALAGDGPYWVQDFGRPMQSGVTASTTTPSCPRAPASDDAVAPAATRVPPAPAAVPTMAAPTARRTGRRLRIGLVLPAGTGRLTVVVRVRQAGRTVRRSVLRRPAGSTQTMTLRLRGARGGQIVVRAGAAAPVSATFR